MNAPYRFGIEEEYFLADAETGLSPSGAAADRFHADAGKAVVAASHELLKGQLEVATKPAADLAVASRSLSDKRIRLSAIAAEHGLRLFAAGSHPLATFAAQRTTQMARYRRLEHEFGILAHRMMVCAMHVHVEVRQPDARIGLMNRLMPFLPLFLAFSVSSPFWEGRQTGLQSFRLSAFSEWPRMGLPELFSDQSAYDRFVNLLVEGGAIRDASFVWWLIRPSVRYPTIELRICDSCTRRGDAVAIAALYRCLVRAVERDVSINAGVGPIERAVTAENIWHVQRDGLAAKLIDPKSGAVGTVRERLDETLAMVGADADALGCVDALAALRTIVERGTSADAQIVAFEAARAKGMDDEAALCMVVTALAETTVL